MTTIRTGGETEAISNPARKNFLRCTLRILIAPSLPMSDVDRLIGLLETADRPQPFHSQLAEYLWEHHMEELVVPGRNDLDLAIERIATAFATLDEDDRCAPTPPLLWLDVSEPLTFNNARLR